MMKRIWGGIVLYFAYGSNLWRQQMTSRCPEHRERGTGSLKGWRWIITTRGYASIVVSKSDYVLGTVYELSEADLLSLDQFEGVSRGNYRKEMISVNVDGRELSCLVYIDPVIEEGAPKDEYIARINSGIKDAGFPDEYITRYIRPFVPALHWPNSLTS
jgi:gamma-glutamylcyclotransferase